MILKINGDNLETSAQTLKELLEEIKMEPKRVAVEVNLNIVKKADYSVFNLKDGDTIEIVNFVGGGQHFKMQARDDK